jgi:hypothetical protein
MIDKTTFLPKTQRVKLIVQDKERGIKLISKISEIDYHDYTSSGLDLVEIMKEAINKIKIQE